MRKKEDRSKPSARQTLGKMGESLAARYLEQKSYLILAKNWRCGRGGEIDLIVYEGETHTLVFVEVKTRKPDEDSLMTGVESITPQKHSRLLNLATLYLKTALTSENSDVSNSLAECPEDMAIRFDLLVIGLDVPKRSAKVLHFKNVCNTDT